MRTVVYRRYLLGLLTVILIFNFMDRFALGLVLQDIKRDLNLTDTQLGFLTGLAFALFYSVMGIPIARWADRGNRVTVIAVTTALWSVAVALCGMAGSFVQLLSIRVGVAVGEAGGFAPGLSLISDYFDRTERPRAIAIYTLGGSLSAAVGYVFAGWLSSSYGWRLMFIWLGVPGLVLGAIAWLTLRDPRYAKSGDHDGERHSTLNTTTVVAQPSLREVAATLWSNITFRNIVLCLSVQFFFIYGIMQWQPAFFIRSHHFTNAQVGNWFALIYGVGGLLGTYLGGELASRFAAHNERLQLRGIAVTMAGCAFLSAGVLVRFHRAVCSEWPNVCHIAGPGSGANARSLGCAGAALCELGRNGSGASGDRRIERRAESFRRRGIAEICAADTFPGLLLGCVARLESKQNC
jgi:MFS transporter, Spinster family, sphingosine-1-phosphate transporter